MAKATAEAGSRSVGTREQLAERARALVSDIRERAARCEEERTVPQETMDAFRAAGTHRVLQPPRFGGAGGPFGGMVDVQTILAEACASTGWVHGQNTIHNFMVSHWPPEGQEEVWGDTPAAFLSGILIPAMGRAKPVDGGYRITGRWPFVSGVNVCDWCLFSCFVEDDSPGPPEHRMFLLQPREFEIIDTWRAVGLRGTCSNDVKVDDVFVPAHRSLGIDDSKGGETPGARINKEPMYQLGSYSMFALVQGSTATGVATGVYKAYVESAKKRIAHMSGKSVADYTTTQVKLGEAAAGLDAARRILYGACDDAMAIVESGRLQTLEERARFRRDGAFAGKLAKRAVDLIWELAGGVALYDTNPLSRGYRDMASVHQHISQNWDVNGSNYGRIALGLESADPTI